MPTRRICSNLQFIKRRPNRSYLASQLAFLLLAVAVLLAQVIPAGVGRDGPTTVSAASAAQIAAAANQLDFAAKTSNTDVIHKIQIQCPSTQKYVLRLN